jgi:hypothetical protein
MSIGDDELAWLERIARSRTEPAWRVARAWMLLTYRTGPSTHAVGEAIGATHQTVQRCLDRAVRFGAMAALEDSPRPGKAAAITDEARAWLVSLAWQKAKELGCFRTNSGRRACWRATSALMSRRLDIPAWGISFKTRSAKSSHAMTSSGSVAKLWLRPCRDKKVVGLATERLTVVDFKVSHFEREIVFGVSAGMWRTRSATASSRG